MPRNVSTILLAAALLAGALTSPAGAGELSDAEFSDASKQARKLMKQTGAWDEKVLKVWDNKASPKANAVAQARLRREKLATIETLGRDNSRRAAEVLVEWTLQSLKLQQGKIAKDLAATKKDYEKADKRARKAEGVSKKYFPPPTWRSKANKEMWLKGKGPYDTAVENHAIEDGVRYMLGEAFGNLTAPEAVTYLIEEGLPKVQKVKGSEMVQVPVARCLLSQDKAISAPIALRMAKDAGRPKLRIFALNWIGRHKAAEGFQAVVDALSAPEAAVRRAAVMAAHALDDIRCVEPLIGTMADAEGQLLDEIEDVLHYYTGKSFESSASVWARWWQDAGAKWFAEQAAKPKQRHATKKEPKKGGTVVKFYGVPTASRHVVFVVDRSGSMATEAGEKSRAKKAEKPKGPVTGGHGKGKEKDSGTIAGDTKMEVAKTQLGLSIDELQKEVQFAVVFYSHDIQVWKEPPELMAATKANKNDVKKWYAKLGPEGATYIFGALKKALEYSDTIGEGVKKPSTGADTIFLLTDGSPTKDGELLTKEEKEQALKEFLEANKLYHCIVHTIGIGPETDKRLLRRLAKETGGTYTAVGDD